MEFKLTHRFVSFLMDGACSVIGIQAKTERSDVYAPFWLVLIILITSALAASEVINCHGECQLDALLLINIYRSHYLIF